MELPNARPVLRFISMPGVSIAVLQQFIPYPIELYRDCPVHSRGFIRTADDVQRCRASQPGERETAAGRATAISSAPIRNSRERFVRQ